jgi:REP element-mobilizing transposase RayT
MARRRLFRTTLYPYHVTARANNRELFPGDFNFVWKCFSSELYLQTILHEIRIHAFVLMPNHFHLLVTSPEAGLDQVMKEFLSSSTRILNTKNHRSGRVFGGRYHWSAILEQRYYWHALRYVYQNPVKAGLCLSPLHYPYSSLAGIQGLQPLPFAVLPPLEGLRWKTSLDTEKWLETSHTEEEAESLKKALKRRIFELPKDRKSRKPRILTD